MGIGGWPSMVLMKKFEEVAEYVHVVERDLIQQIQDGDIDPAGQLLKDLREVCLKLIHPMSKTLIGPFAPPMDKSPRDTKLRALANVFGLRPSWLWLLPMRPGGHGDPLGEVYYNEVACAS